MTAQELFILIVNYEEQNSNHPYKVTSLADCKKAVGQVSFSEQDFTKFVRKTYPKLPKDFERCLRVNRTTYDAVDVTEQMSQYFFYDEDMDKYAVGDMTGEYLLCMAIISFNDNAAITQIVNKTASCPVNAQDKQRLHECFKDLTLQMQDYK